MTKMKLIETEDGVGVILPQDILAHLGVDLGDELYLSDCTNGFRLSVDEPVGAAD